MKANPSPSAHVIDVAALSALLADSPALGSVTLVDVRKRFEYREGHIPGATHLALEDLRQQSHLRLPDRNAAIVVYCSSGDRSLRAARLLAELGYASVMSLDGGVDGWRRLGGPVTGPVAVEAANGLSAEQLERYSRHLSLPRFGEEQQLRLLGGRVLIVGLGGLGAPAAIYLAAAGVGTLGLLDDDTVELSNLQRQILHATSRIGAPKVESANGVLTDLNRDVKTISFKTRLGSDNIDSVFSLGWDVVIDGSDNYPTRYLVNDAGFFHKIPVIHGSVFQFEGRIMTTLPGHSPCYRCAFPEPPPAHLVQSCEAGGVLGVLPGLVGVLQATEALKVLLGLGEPLLGRLLTVDALSMRFHTLTIPRNRACTLCGDNPGITAYVDYEGFCKLD